MNACPVLGIGLESKATAQCRAAAQEMPSAKARPPARLGSAFAVHALPFQVTATGIVAESLLEYWPTATQYAADVHDTPRR